MLPYASKIQMSWLEGSAVLWSISSVILFTAKCYHTFYLCDYCCFFLRLQKASNCCCTSSVCVYSAVSLSLARSIRYMWVRIGIHFIQLVRSSAFYSFKWGPTGSSSFHFGHICSAKWPLLLSLPCTWQWSHVAPLWLWMMNAGAKWWII